MPNSPASRKALGLQRRWRADALRDERYLRKMAKEVRSPVLRQTYIHEANVARYWANRRGAAIRKQDPSHRV